MGSFRIIIEAVGGDHKAAEQKATEFAKSFDGQATVEYATFESHPRSTRATVNRGKIGWVRDLLTGVVLRSSEIEGEPQKGDGAPTSEEENESDDGEE